MQEDIAVMHTIMNIKTILNHQEIAFSMYKLNVKDDINEKITKKI